MSETHADYVAEALQALEDDERYTNGWPDFCPGPEAVRALVEVAEAARPVVEAWDAGRLTKQDERQALREALAALAADQEPGK